MEIDFGTLLIGSITVAICAVPFVLTIGGRKRREKQMMRSLYAMAAQHSCVIGLREFCGNYVLAMDKTGRFVFFHRMIKKKTEEQAVDLMEIATCRPMNIGRKIAGERVVERLGLEFVPMDKATSEIHLELYNNDHSFQLRGELQSMEKWVKLINESLNKLRPVI
ncbi:hypothetical protein D2V93_12045 [Flagellimonas taeanensis]|jgi:hypothetical protein|uniref:hypothetical protein n=1 Tax=Flavobacteriaceae TaxID=49546 RepID=UPI000E6A3781|nr:MULTISPECIES: hypothetical protein [Allomuricauda]MDC6384164.1 hypothetical protein [Muricauda sp. SK9]MEE1962244.1 hypothetical protein [Allomuricauda taeanensis]RIV49537.1 hypothetical protein D2V93_12045 [Allomuricauda taeanensis]